MSALPAAAQMRLAERIRFGLLGTLFSERRMFGAVVFMVQGHMLCAATRKGLMLRVGPAGMARALADPAARPFDGAGRPMTGFVLVAPEGFDRDEALEAWLELGLAFVTTLPPKAPRPPRKPPTPRGGRF
ncbi:MAG: TfoX/Sxy family protein [Rhodocyclaceae bacterium]|jgi:hypothetical protein|nr:TfoX/Sxy family protein [Rhodocyclaceae bacterium]